MFESKAIVTLSSAAAREQLPQHQPAGVHVDAQEGVAVEADGALQHLGGHVAPRAHQPVSLAGCLARLKLESQTKVGDAGGQVGLEKHVLGLEVTVSDCWLGALHVNRFVGQHGTTM